MKIIGASSHIKVKFDNKIVKIQGEMMVNGFLAYSDTIKNWEPPFENILIDEVTKMKLIKAVLD